MLLYGVTVLFVVGMAWLMVWYMRVQHIFTRHPTFEEYVEKHPHTRTMRHHGADCVHCGSDKVGLWGLGGRNDHRRLVACGQCGEGLFRREKGNVFCMPLPFYAMLMDE